MDLAHVKLKIACTFYLIMHGMLLVGMAKEEGQSLIGAGGVDKRSIPLILTLSQLQDNLKEALYSDNDKQMQECYNTISKNIMAQRGTPDSYNLTRDIKYQYYDDIEKYIPKEISEYCQKDCRRAVKKELKEAIELNRPHISKKNMRISILQCCGVSCLAGMVGVGAFFTMVFFVNGPC